MAKEYLGDGVYVEHDGRALVLTAENGLRVVSRIVLDSAVYYALTMYAERRALRGAVAEAAKADTPESIAEKVRPVRELLDGLKAIQRRRLRPEKEKDEP